MKLLSNKIEKRVDVFLGLFAIVGYLLGFLPNVCVDFDRTQLFYQQFIELIQFFFKLPLLRDFGSVSLKPFLNLQSSWWMFVGDKLKSESHNAF